MEPIYINKISSFDYTIGEYEGESYAKIVDPDYKNLIVNSNLRRRMSRIIKMGVASALSCLGDDENTPLDAIITATGWGCLDDTEKFLKDLIKYDEGALNPTTFIQSTFNTIGAQIALLLNAKPYNMTYVHRNFSMESALLDAILFLNDDKQNILVGGFDELTPTSFSILRRLGVYDSVLAGEGANFFLLSNERKSSTLAQFIGLDIKNAKPEPEAVRSNIMNFLSKYNLTPSDLSLLVLGKNNDVKLDAIYDTILNDLLFINVRKTSFKQKCGEYPTAIAYGLVDMINELGVNRGSDGYGLLLNITAMGTSMILIKR